MRSKVLRKGRIQKLADLVVGVHADEGSNERTCTRACDHLGKKIMFQKTFDNSKMIKSENER